MQMEVKNASAMKHFITMHNPWQILRMRLLADFPRDETRDDHGKKADFIRVTGISRATLDRWLKEETSAKIEELGRLAKWYRCQPWELIKPDGAEATKPTPLEALEIIREALKSQQVPAEPLPKMPKDILTKLQTASETELQIVRGVLGIKEAESKKTS